MKWVVLWVVFWVGRAIFEILVSFDGLMLLLLFVVFEYWKKSIDDSLSTSSVGREVVSCLSSEVTLLMLLFVLLGGYCVICCAFFA